MLKVGITGGIGSGKTTVCKVFEALGIPVFYADDEARKISNLPAIQQSILDVFGSSIATNEKIDRSKLAAIVFADDNELKKLNAIIHPEVDRAFAQWQQQHLKQPYILKEAAILFESGTNRFCDQVITVTANTELRIQRVIKRDKTSAAAVKRRIEKQLSDEEKIKRSDFVIHNNEHDLLVPQILLIHDKLLQKAAE